MPRNTQLAVLSTRWEYGGKDPNGFMPRDEIVDYLEGFAKSFNPPIREGITVKELKAELTVRLKSNLLTAFGLAHPLF